MSIDSTDYNRRAWDRLAQAGNRFYKAVTPEEIQNARQGKFRIRLTPTKPLPAKWLEPIEGRRVLCLAGGGARQGPLLAAAGADVTVFDLSEQQLMRDREVAKRDSLNLKTVAGDMRDLSVLADGSFDLIVSPCATCFCPDVKPIWNECSRVLCEDGQLIVGFIDPVHYLFDAKQRDAGRLVVRHSIPYSDEDLPSQEREALLGPERPLEFGHSLTSLIGDQLAAGFRLIDLFQDRWSGREPVSQKVATFLCTRSEKTG